MRALIVGGSPEPSSAATVRAAAAGCDAVVAVDRGLDALLAARVPVDLFCGDADSVSPAGASLVRAAERGAADFEVERYDPRKDATDLALALSAVRARWGEAPVRCTCLSGGNPDHALAALGRLAGWGAAVEIEEDAFSGRVLRAGLFWEPASGRRPAPMGARFSFIPLTASAVVSERGMRWALDRARVPLLSDLGISNVIERADARVSCHEGTIACWAFLRPFAD